MREKCINFSESGLKHVRSVALKHDLKMKLIFMYNVNFIEEFCKTAKICSVIGNTKLGGKKLFR